MRPGEIHDQDFAARLDHPERFLERPGAMARGLFVQQEEQHDPVIACVGQPEVRGIHAQQSHLRAAGQLLFQIAQLDRHDVDHIELAIPGGNAPFQPCGQIAVNAGQLQDVAGCRLAEFGQRAVAQPVVIAQQDEVDDPKAVEEFHSPWMDISPPVMAAQIKRDAGIVGGQQVRSGRLQRADFVYALEHSDRWFAKSRRLTKMHLPARRTMRRIPFVRRKVAAIAS